MAEPDGARVREKKRLGAGVDIQRGRGALRFLPQRENRMADRADLVQAVER